MRERSPDKSKIVAILGAAVAAVVLVAGFLLAPPMGTDLSAQVARTDFFRRYGWAPVDMGWYGGVSPHGYSLVSPSLMAWLGGPRLVGGLAAVVSTVALAALLVRTDARHPLLGGVLGAACFVGNLVSGRVTYAVGVAFGLLALLALTFAPPWLRRVGAVVGAALAAATSPVAGLFVGLAGVALALAYRRDRRRLVDAGLLAAGAAVPMAGMGLLFGTGGWMNISRSDTIHAVLTGLAVAALVPRRAVRIGALLSALGVAAAFALHTPVGLNATRLASMFALPIVAAYADFGGARRRARPWAPAVLAAVLFALAWWQPPVLIGDLRDAGDVTARESYFAPLRAELTKRAPIGRVEVVATRNYWESAYVPPVAPLARGWLRQADLAHNGLFFDGTLDAASYEGWLRRNGVSYVALPDAAPAWVSRREAELIRDGLRYLAEVWRGEHWVLYAVEPRPSIVDGGALVAADQEVITVDVPAPGDVPLRVRWSRWLRLSGPAGACLAPQGEWTVLRASRPGRYAVGSGLAERGPAC